MRIEDIKAIDVHGHFDRPENTSTEVELYDSGVHEVVRLASIAKTSVTIASSLMTLWPRFKADAYANNAAAAEAAAAADGLLLWVVVDPTNPKTYAQAAEILKRSYCAGIKIHPEEHGYPISEHGRDIFEFAAMHRAIVETHSGEQRSLPADFVEFANDFPEVKLILSHLGCGWDNDATHQVRAIQKTRHGNVFTDTSSYASIMRNLIEWAVREVGAECILYGTDTPLHHPPMYRARIDNAEMGSDEKRLILRSNALVLFGDKLKAEVIKVEKE